MDLRTGLLADQPVDFNVECIVLSEKPLLGRSGSAKNILGDSDLGLDYLITPTEIEMEVQMPTCAKMAKDKSKALHPDTAFQNIVVHHWIKVS